MVHLGEVSPAIWDIIVEQMEKALKEIDFQEDDILWDWKPSADSRRLERELYEKYGMFKDIILDPRFQYWKQFAEERVNFNPVLGDSVLPFATAVIILFMLHKRVSNNLLMLVAAFIFNINPFYVCCGSFIWWLMHRSKKPKLFNSIPSRTIPKDTDTYAPKQFSKSNNPATSSTKFDHVLIGNDISTLYSAALLSKNGHKCCVLMPKGAPPLSVQPDDTPYAIPTRNPIVGKVERYQVYAT